MTYIPKVHDFKIGDTIVFDPSKVSSWSKLSDDDKYKYYGKFYLSYFRKAREEEC